MVIQHFAHHVDGILKLYLDIRQRYGHPDMYFLGTLDYKFENLVFLIKLLHYLMVFEVSGFPVNYN